MFRAERLTDMTKVIGAFRNFEKAPKAIIIIIIIIIIRKVLQCEA